MSDSVLSRARWKLWRQAAKAFNPAAEAGHWPQEEAGLVRWMVWGNSCRTPLCLMWTIWDFPNKTNPVTGGFQPLKAAEPTRSATSWRWYNKVPPWGAHLLTGVPLFKPFLVKKKLISHYIYRKRNEKATKENPKQITTDSSRERQLQETKSKGQPVCGSSRGTKNLSPAAWDKKRSCFRRYGLLSVLQNVGTLG